MTNQHPLTGEVIEQIAQFNPDLTAELRLNRTNDMREAADWQLEQVVEFASKYTWLAFRDTGEKAQFIQKLKKAMRPTQEDNS